MNITRSSLTAFATLALITTSGAAYAAEACALSYETFETAIPHIDMEDCPAGENAKGMFCRATVAADQLHVFYFAEAGEQCLLKVSSYDDDAFSVAVKAK